MRDERPCRRCKARSTWWLCRVGGSLVLHRDRPAPGSGTEVVRQIVVGTDDLCVECRKALEPPPPDPGPVQRSLFDE